MENSEPPELPPPSPRPRLVVRGRRLVNTAAVATALAGGGVIGAVVGAPLISSAESDAPTESTIEPSTSVDDDGADDESTTSSVPADERSSESNGSTSKDGDDGCDFHIGYPMGGHGIPGGPWIDTIADALGMEPDELVDVLREQDSTLADIAEDRGVDVDELVEAVIAEARNDLAEHADDVGQGFDEILARLRERITEMIEGEWPAIDFDLDVDVDLDRLRDHFPPFRDGIPGRGPSGDRHEHGPFGRWHDDDSTDDADGRDTEDRDESSDGDQNDQNDQIDSTETDDADPGVDSVPESTTGGS